PESGASCDDHLEVADALQGLGRTDDAEKRVDRALTCDERSVRAWDLAASLREDLGNPSRAVEALWRASLLLSGHEAAHRLHHAASLCEADDLERALDLVRAAVERDPGDARGQTTLARIAQAFGASDEALEAAKTALELATALGPEADEMAVIAALAGGAASLEGGRAVDALRFFSLVLASQPDHPDALAGRGESLAELGDLAGAHRALEARLDQSNAYPARAHHLMLVGLHFAALNEPEAALERFEAAIRDDPKLDEAHRQIATLHEASDHIEAGIACLERWAAFADEPGVRAARLLQAAEWELRSDGQQEAAERHLRQILKVDPGCGRAWQMLTDVLRATDRSDEALATSALALAGLEDADVVAALALTRGQLLEERGDLREAADAFGTTASRCAEAALSRARLLRTLGDWQAAADTLREFVAMQSGGDLTGLTESLEQLGQLLAGPLEEFDAAITVYQRAVHMDPDREEARRTLAGLLARKPDQWRVAVDHLRRLLDSDPTDRASLRTVLDIAREQGRDTALDNGLAILRALGIASERELEEAPATLSFRVASDPRLPDPAFEALRRLAHGAARVITRDVDATENPELPSSGDFASAVLTAEARLTAPALLPLSDEQLGEVLRILATLILEPAEVHGDGALVNSLSAALGCHSRRRLRRALAGPSLGALCAVEAKAWRLEVRTLARAVALDDGGGDLRGALEG
ncbi:MAG: tetratricopeptide repeat protein, partial [Deltaproteobacteria bacterium]|nr:tetratricopeptide repeat protein [Deltaproteobacteria bacterium]